MIARTSSAAAAAWPNAEVRALAAAVLLFAGFLAFLSSCGSGDLVFPGQVVSTATSTCTPTSTPGATDTPSA